jgi:hypothetical protein
MLHVLEHLKCYKAPDYVTQPFINSNTNMLTSFLSTLALTSLVLASSPSARTGPLHRRTDRILAPRAIETSSKLDSKNFPGTLIAPQTTALDKRADADNNGIDDSNTYDYIYLSQEVFNAQNRARCDPNSFAVDLEDYGHYKAAEACRKAIPVPSSNCNLVYEVSFC